MAKREREQRQRRHEAQPHHHRQHVDLPLAPHQDVAAGPGNARREHKREPEGRHVAGALHRRADAAEAGAGDEHARDLPQRRTFAKHERGEEDREEDLGLHHDRGETRRHADLHAREQERELAEEPGTADQDQPLPGQRRPRQDEAGKRRDEEAQGREKQRRERAEPPLNDNEVEAPERRDEHREGDMDGFHDGACLTDGGFVTREPGRVQSRGGMGWISAANGEAGCVVRS